MIGTITAEVGLAVIKKITAAWLANKGSGGDLIKFTTSSRVEPICLIDSDVIHHEMLPDVLQCLQSIFSGYYLQALAISTNVGKISIVKQLDKLNPNRSVGGNLADSANWLMSMESYQDISLPRIHKRPSMEALNSPEYKNNKLKSDAVVDKYTDNKDKLRNGASTDKEALVTVRELTNLSVGKLINVEITDGANKATVPISIRLMATHIPTSSIVHILSVGNKDVTLKERYHGWRSGRLEFWKDIVLAQDLIDAHKKNLLNDKTGVYSEILKRRSTNEMATIASGEPSLATASNLLVCSRETIRTLEGEIGREFKDFKTREKIFNESYLMIIAVIDKEWDRVTFYHRGINLPTEVSLRDIKASNKNSGPDVSEIMKAYMLGRNPSF